MTPLVGVKWEARRLQSSNPTRAQVGVIWGFYTIRASMALNTLVGLGEVYTPRTISVIFEKDRLMQLFLFFSRTGKAQPSLERFGSGSLLSYPKPVLHTDLESACLFSSPQAMASLHATAIPTDPDTLRLSSDQVRAR